MTPADKAIADAIAALEPIERRANECAGHHESTIVTMRLSDLRPAAQAKAGLEAVRDAKPAPDVIGERAPRHPDEHAMGAFAGYGEPWKPGDSLEAPASPALPPVAGLETTAAERVDWLSHAERHPHRQTFTDQAVVRLIRDIDRLLAALAEARADGLSHHNGLFARIDALQAELAEARADAKKAMEEEREIDILFDGPSSHESGRFVEVESPPGTSIRFGEWVDRGDGLWALRFRSRTDGDEA